MSPQHILQMGGVRVMLERAKIFIAAYTVEQFGMLERPFGTAQHPMNTLRKFLQVSRNTSENVFEGRCVRILYGIRESIYRLIVCEQRE